MPKAILKENVWGRPVEGIAYRSFKKNGKKFYLWRKYHFHFVVPEDKLEFQSTLRKED